jgi:hypothetical protein
MISSMIVFEDLIDYESGIYKYQEGGIVGAHAILLVGFGETEDG